MSNLNMDKLEDGAQGFILLLMVMRSIFFLKHKKAINESKKPGLNNLKMDL